MDDEDKNDFKSKRQKLDTRDDSKFGKQRPNWFIAIPFEEENIKDELRSVQEAIVEKNTALKRACIPPTKLHLTLFVFYSEDIEKVSDTISKVVDRFPFEEEIKINANEIGHFSNQVIFSRLVLSPNLEKFWQYLADELFSNSIIDANDAKMENFKPHLTIMKLSKMRRPKKGEEKIKKIPPSMYEMFKSKTFGIQNVRKIQLLSMTLPQLENGNYYCHQDFPLKMSIRKTPILCNTQIICAVSCVTALLSIAVLWKKFKR